MAAMPSEEVEVRGGGVRTQLVFKSATLKRKVCMDVKGSVQVISGTSGAYVFCASGASVFVLLF